MDEFNSIRHRSYRQAPSPLQINQERPGQTDEEDIEDTEDEQSGGEELYSDNGEERFGTSSIVNVLNQLPNKSSGNLFDTILVNVMTIVRNNTTLNTPDKEIKDMVIDDIVRIIDAAVAYQENMSNMLSNPLVVFYLPDYSWLPALHMRNPSPTRTIINRIVEDLIKDDNLRVKKQIRSHKGSSAIYELFAGGKTMLPYKSILKLINQINTLGVVDTATQLAHYLLISHCPLDYHLLLKYRRASILESFTGKILQPKELGYKVFGNNFIPFNSVTHLIFGDPVHVRPMAQRKNRKLLTDMAMKQQWYIRTPSEIAQFVGASGQADANILMHVKL